MEHKHLQRVRDILKDEKLSILAIKNLKEDNRKSKRLTAEFEELAVLEEEKVEIEKRLTPYLAAKALSEIDSVNKTSLGYELHSVNRRIDMILNRITLSVKTLAMSTEQIRRISKYAIKEEAKRKRSWSIFRKRDRSATS